MTVATALGFRNSSDSSRTDSVSSTALMNDPLSIHQMNAPFYVISIGNGQFNGQIIDPSSYSSFYDSIEPGRNISIAFWANPEKLFLISTIQKLGETNLGKSFLASFKEKPIVYKVYSNPNDLSPLKQAVWNYTGFRRIGFPVPIHYDLEDYMKDFEFRKIYESSNFVKFDEFVSANVIHGYHLAEPCHSFPSCEKAKELIDKNKLSENKCEDLYNQLKKMFKTIYERRILADLKIENTGIILKNNPQDEDNPILEVVYTDPTYVCKLSDPESFDQAIEELLITFAPRGTGLYEFLNPIPSK